MVGDDDPPTANLHVLPEDPRAPLQQESDSEHQEQVADYGPVEGLTSEGVARREYAEHFWTYESQVDDQSDDEGRQVNCEDHHPSLEVHGAVGVTPEGNP